MNAIKKLLLTLLGAFLSLQAAAQSFTFTHDGVELTYTVLDDNTCAIAESQSKTLTTAPIPPSVSYNGTTYSVVKISSSAFSDCNALTSVVMPNTVTYLGPYSFQRCTALKSVTLSNALTAINGVTFSGCTNLESIVIPPSVTQIHGGAFDNSGLKKVYMGPNVVYIGEYVFRNAPLTDIYITSKAAPGTKADQSPFSAYTATLHLQGETAQTAYSKATNWSNFTNIILMDVPSQMDTYNGVSIASTAPLTAGYGETKTAQMFLAPGKTANFTTWITPSNVDVTKLFWTSSAPDKVYVDRNGTVTCNTILDSEVTITCKSIYSDTPVFKITFLRGHEFASGNGPKMFYTVTDETNRTCSMVACSDTNSSTITVPASAVIDGENYTVTEIGASAFAGHPTLTNVTIPTTVKTIRLFAFADSKALKSIVIPNSVTQIGAYLFRGCTALNSVTLSNAITTINGVTFYGCTSLKSIIIPPSVKQIYGGAFHKSGLEKVYMGPDVAYIGEVAFADTPLTDIYITSKAAPGTKADQSPFSAYTATLHLQGEDAQTAYSRATNWSNFKNIVLMDAPTKMSTYNAVSIFSSSPLTAKSGETKTGPMLLPPGKSASFTSSITPANIDITKVFWTSSAPEKVFVDQNGKVTFIALPDSEVILTGRSIYNNSPVLKVIANPVFAYAHDGGPVIYYSIIDEEQKKCSVVTCENNSISQVIIPTEAVINGKNYTVTTLGAKSFSGFAALTNATLPHTITKISPNAFEDCTSLTSAVLPNSLTELGSYVFQRCTALKSVTLSNALTAINGVTFSGCTKLESIVIPPSVTQIHGGAFDNSGLKKVYMGPNMVYIGEYVFRNTPLTDIYITSKAAPGTKADQSPFSAYTATLHLQGEDALTAYSKATNWSNFQNIVLMNTPSRMETYNSRHYTSSLPLSANAGETKNGSLFIAPGNMTTFTTSLTPPSLDTQRVFWTSTAPDKVYVDQNGKVTFLALPESEISLDCVSIYGSSDISRDACIMKGE